MLFGKKFKIVIISILSKSIFKFNLIKHNSNKLINKTKFTYLLFYNF